MNEAQQTATLATMTDKDLTKLMKRLDAQVTDLKAEIAFYEKTITLAGAQEHIDWINARNAAAGSDVVAYNGKSAAVVAADHATYYAKTHRIHQAKLVTKTRRLVQAAGEAARRDAQKEAR